MHELIETLAIAVCVLMLPLVRKHVFWRKCDFYILSRVYYNRVYTAPWREGVFSAHYQGFDDYFAAKVVFNFWEEQAQASLDCASQEAEHILYVVEAYTKADALRVIRSNGVGEKHRLHETPYAAILERRAFWKKNQVAV